MYRGRFETDCDQSEVHLHEEMEILYVLTGRVSMTVNDLHFILEPEGVMALNPFEFHQLTRETGGHTLSLYIPLGLLEQVNLGRIVCCSSLQPEKKIYLEILRSKLAGLFVEYQNPSGNEFHRLSYLFALLGALRQEFEEHSTVYPISGSDAMWLGEVFSYIRSHLREKLSLQAVANIFYLSPSHFSRKIQHLTGKAFSGLVREMRMKTAENLLVHTRLSVTEIAAQCGFATPNTLIYDFQRHFDYTPGKYRRARQGAGVYQTESGDVSYMSLTHHISHDDRNIYFSQTAEAGESVRVDVKDKGLPLHLPHKYMIGGGYASDLLLESTQVMVRRAMKEIGYRYILVQGILNQSMNVYHAESDGSLRLNYNYVDIVFDFVLSVGGIPWIVLNYTPPELVKGEKHFFGSSCMNLPDDLVLWEDIITEFLGHLTERYGMRNVQNWYFSMEQALYEYYGLFTLEEYERFYHVTYCAIRRVIPNAHILGFGLDTGIVTLEGEDILSRLLRFGRENHCLPNELTFQSFGCDYGSVDRRKTEKELVDLQQDQLEEPVPVSYDQRLLTHELEKIKEIMKAEGCGGIPISLAIMCNSIWQRDLGNDTCFKSAWIIKNILENAHLFLGASVPVTEFTERSLMNPNVFHGGYGVMSFLGFPKAGYHALTLLSRLKGKVISQGDGYMITSVENGEEIMFMLYHYCHYDRETHLISQLPIREQRIYDRYYGFEKKGPRSFQFILENMDPGIYETDTYLVNRSFGSSYDIWMDMGAPERFTPSQQAYLERVAVPKYHFERYPVDGSGRLLFSVLLEPHEIRLIHMKKK